MTGAVTSIGSEQNPIQDPLPPGVILELIDRLSAAQRERAASGGRSRRTKRPRPCANQSLSHDHRIWLDHALGPLIDRSVSTVKADTPGARSSPRAGIVGGDRFQRRPATCTGSPPSTSRCPCCTATSPAGGDGSPTALVDVFGHGTHVAGIIAAALRIRTPVSPTGLSRRESADQAFEENIKTIGGMAPSCKLVSMKVLNDRGRSRNIIALSIASRRSAITAAT